MLKLEVNLISILSYFVHLDDLRVLSSKFISFSSYRRHFQNIWALTGRHERMNTILSGAHLEVLTGLSDLLHWKSRFWFFWVWWRFLRAIDDNRGLVTLVIYFILDFFLSFLRVDRNFLYFLDLLRFLNALDGSSIFSIIYTSTHTIWLNNNIGNNIIHSKFITFLLTVNYFVLKLVFDFFIWT